MTEHAATTKNETKTNGPAIAADPKPVAAPATMANAAAAHLATPTEKEIVRRPRATSLDELQAMSKIAAILGKLPNEESQRRVLSGLAEAIGG